MCVAVATDESSSTCLRVWFERMVTCFGIGIDRVIWQKHLCRSEKAQQAGAS